MAFDPDGTNFVGLDADIFGDGDADSQALDVYICQRLRGNQYFLNSGNRSVARAYFSSADAEDDGGNYQGERPIATIEPGDIISLPFRLERGLESVTLHMLVHCFDQGTGTDGVNYTLIVRDPFGQSITSTSGTIADDDGTGYDIETITATLSAYAGTPGIGQIIFRIQSTDAGDTGVGLTIASPSSLRWVATSSGFIFNRDPGVESGSPEVRYLLSDDSGVAIDLFAVDDTGTKDSSDIVFPDRSVEPDPAISNAYSMRYMSYLQIRSIDLELGYAEDRFGRVGLGDLAAQQTVKGPTSITQAESINQYNRAPKLVAWGPDDYTDAKQQASWATDYRLRWPIAVGDGNADTIIDDTFMCVDENPTFEILALVTGTVDVGGNITPGIDFEGGSSDWIFNVAVDQFDTSTSDWTAPTTLGSAIETRTVNTWATDWREARFLRSKTILHDYSGATGSPFSGTLSSNLDSWQFAFKEGILFEEDYRLFSLVRLRVDTSSLTYSDTLTPLRLRVSATYDDGTIDLAAVGDVTAASALGEVFHLTCVGYTIYEVQ